MSLIPFQFDEYCDLVGGMEWSEFLKSLLDSGKRHRHQVLKKDKGAIVSNDDFLYQNDSVNRLPLEIFYLKIGMFIELCRRAQERQIIQQKPLAGLLPHNIRLRIDEDNGLVPKLWNFFLEIRDTAPDEAEHADLQNSTFWQENFDLYFETESGFEDITYESNLYSLGMLLFRALLVNQSQDSVHVLQTCKETAEIFSSQQHVAISNLNQLTAQLLSMVQGNPIFSKKNVIFSAGSISEQQNFTVINNDLWTSALMVGFRLICHSTAIGYNAKSQTNRQHNWQYIDLLVHDLESIKSKIRQALFIDPPNIDSDIHELLNTLIDDPGWVSQLSHGSFQMPGVKSSANSPSKRVSKSKAPSTAQTITPVLDMDETIIVKNYSPDSAQHTQENNHSMPHQRSALTGLDNSTDVPSGGSLDETIIVSPNKNHNLRPEKDKQDSKETSIPPKYNLTEPDRNNDIENLDETIIIPAKKND